MEVLRMTCNPRDRVRPAPRLELPADEALARSRAFLEAMRTRRTVRDLSDRPVPFELVRNAVATAATAPSGANLQPWRFVIVSDPERKRRLRAAAEQEELGRPAAPGSREGTMSGDTAIRRNVRRSQAADRPCSPVRGMRYREWPGGTA
jgi:nitroreductase